MTITEIPTTTDNPPADAGPTPTSARSSSGPPPARRSSKRHAADYDRDGTWVHDSFEHIRDAGLLAIAVPTELGGDGATISEVAAVQRELAKSCGSTALASAMHQHVTAFTTWRYRRNLPGAEATLRRIAEDGIVVVSTGGGDYTHPRGTAVKVDGGYRVSGRKSFVSQSPVGAVLSTMFVYDDPDRGLRVLNMSVPFASDGVRIVERWDTLGMRGTSSHDVDFDDVFVPDERVLADRPHGEIDAPLQVISSIGFVVISAVYLGIAEGAYAHAVASARRQAGVDHRPAPGRSDDPSPPGRRMGARGSAGRGRRRPGALDGHRRRGDARQARDRPRRRSRSATWRWRSAGAPPSTVARRSSGPTATCAPPSSIRSTRSSRWSTPVVLALGLPADRPQEWGL